jgi:hypothetical protein
MAILQIFKITLKYTHTHTHPCVMNVKICVAFEC